MKIDPLQASFNAGELSPRLHARTDFVKYPSGLEECKNLIPLPEGGLTRRPGTRFVAEVADSAIKGRLFGFEATAEQHHVLELGENKIRFFFRQGQQVVLDTDAVVTNGLFPSDISDWDDRSTGGAGNQISHDSSNERLTLETSGVAADDIGWAEQDITTTDTDQEHVIKFEVIGDPGDKIEFQVGSSSVGSETLSPVEKLVGYHCVAFTPTTSPFYIQFRNLGINADKDIQIDNVSFIDNSALEIDSPYIEDQLFQIMGAQSNDVKYLFRSGVAPYKLERRALASWSLIRVAWLDGPYITQNTTATTLTPAATSGVAVAVTASSIVGINDGVGFKSTDVGRLIRIDNGAFWGWGIIVGITSALIVDVHVKKTFAASSSTADWRLGAWSDTTGWPKTGGFFEQRLYVASTDDQSQTLWGSQTGDFENFKPDDDTGTVEADDALNFTLSADSVNEIRWLSAGEDTLAIGTTGGEWIPSASGIVITPLDITIRRQTTHGSALIAPLRIDHVVLFVQRARRKIREFVFNFEIDSFLAPDLTRLAQHITAPGIGEMAFQQEPDSLVWVARSDGVLLSLTFRRDEDVVGWAQHNIGGSGSTGEAASFTITGGSTSAGVNTISSVSIGGTGVLSSPVDYDTDDEVTATALLRALNSSGYDLGTATEDGIEFLPSGANEAEQQEIRFSGDGTKIWWTHQDPFDVDILQATLPTPWDLNGAIDDGVVLNNMSTLLTGHIGSQGLDFRQDTGTVMFTCTPGGSLGRAIHSWNITAWTPGTAAYSGKSLDLDAVVDSADAFGFSHNGLYLFVLDSTNSVLKRLDLSIPWDHTTATEAQSLDLSGEHTSPRAFKLALNGLRLFVVSDADESVSGDTVYQYNFTSAYDLTTITLRTSALLGDSDHVWGSSPFGYGVSGIEIGDEGRRLIVVVYLTPTTFVQYTLTPTSVPIAGWIATADGSEITLSNPTPFSGADSAVHVTTTGDVTVSQNSFTLASTGVSVSDSVVTISGNDGDGQVQNSEDRNEVWVTVKRTINGETKRYVEFLEGYYDDLLHDQEDAYYADSIITYDGELTDTIIGLSHLEGETVKVWGDGAILPDVVVSNGQITLSTSVMVAQIGLAYTHRLKTLKIEGGNPAGTAMGKKKRINGITFVLLNSHTLTFGPDDDNLFKTDFRLVSDPMDAGVPLFTGEQFYEFDGGLATDTRIIVESDDPAPFTLLAMIPEVKVNPSK